jgi:hypothetical protein
LTMKRNNKSTPDCLFVVGDSGLNIRQSQAYGGNDSKDKRISNAIFGKGPKDSVILGKGVISHYGESESGFQISSCQFALHYFFQNKITFHGFLRNVSECTRDQGYFIATCYDGKKLFKLLSPKKENESVVFMNNKSKICEIVKKYSDTGFPDDESSLGYTVDVYQESIGQFAREYLVNFTLFIEMMDNYGFKLVSKDEAQQMGLPNSTGLFSELYDNMKNEIRRRPSAGIDYKDAPFMSTAEQSVSFLNRYFVFRKVMSVDAAKKEKLFLQNDDINDINERFDTVADNELRKRPSVKGDIIKTKMRIKLQKSISSVFSIQSDE